MNPTLAGPYLQKGALCESILRLLPDWFGIESAIQHYAAEIDRLPTFLACVGDQVVGFISLKQHTPYSAEVYVMGVRPEAQRRGVGRLLLYQAEAYIQGQGCEYLQVKTLGPSHPDAHYARTRQFYQALDFRPLEEFKQIWDEHNPCLILVKRL